MRITAEWQEAPGVTDAALARTWARITIASSKGTSLVGLLTGGSQYREAVYGSALPLALWFAENYWNILFEGSRAPVMRGARQLRQVDELRPWVGRHGLLSAGGGFLFPDLTISSDGHACLLRVVPDPRPAATSSAHRFVADVVEREPRSEVRSGIQQFVSDVLERVRDVQGVEPEDLRRNWSGVLQSEAREARFCELAAMLGIDPYGDEQIVADVDADIDRAASLFGEALVMQLLGSAPSLASFRRGIAWLHSASAHQRLDLSGNAVPAAASDWIRPAHEIGYERATTLRRELGLGMAGIDLSAHLQRLGVEPQAITEDADCPEFIRGVAARSKTSLKARVVGPSLSLTADRFRMARALYGWHFGGGPKAATLVGIAHERSQRESRAFAAEFLAPWAGLRSWLAKEGVSADAGPAVVQKLADAYQVGARVIEHQFDNHGYFAADG